MIDADADPTWAACRYATCSVLPVRVACDLSCRFCFSKSSVSRLRHERTGWADLDVTGYYRWAWGRGARRLVITGGGEPLLRPDDVVDLVQQGRTVYEEIALFTHGLHLTPALTRRLADAGLSYLCWSRHHQDDARNRELMGAAAPALTAVLAAAEGLRVRATCVMARGWVDDRDSAWRYAEHMARHGVRELTFKHTYVVHERSLFSGSAQDSWAALHRVAADPFAGEGEIVGSLPWGPAIRDLGGLRVCWYHEPTPAWERKEGLCRSSNLLSDGSLYASLEDHRSRLCRRIASPPPSSTTRSSPCAPSSPSATPPAWPPTAPPPPA